MSDIKAVTIIRSGGFAGAIRQYRVDADSLPQSQRHELENLTLSISQAAGAAGAERRKRPDGFNYEIRIRTSHGEHIHHIAESGEGDALQSLLKLCQDR